ncbi:zinc-ribbon domain-containing protein [uncultured Methanospirillum sp.]|uniref:zinc-ribbon domain-containing protein n=1 Tax=uncultured Methanospirillum sp. TaxID=262503 RepID=UPI00374A86B9
MYCPSCGEKLGDSTRFCPKCGAEIDGGSQVNDTRRSRSGRYGEMDPKDRMMRLVWALVVVLAFMLFFAGYHYLKASTGLP